MKQQAKYSSEKKSPLATGRAAVTDSFPSNIYFFFPEKGNCKGFLLREFPRRKQFETVATTSPASLFTFQKKQPLLSVKGNILYDVNYRSNIDTPFAQKEVYQHTVQTYLDVTWKNNYPFRVYLTNHFGNSPYFRNYSDINFQWNPNEFSNKIKQQLLDILLKEIKYDSLQLIKKLLDQKQKELSELQNWSRDPALLQRLVEEREKQLTIRKNTFTANIADSILPGNLKKPFNIKLANYKFDKKSISDSLSNKFRDSSSKKSLTNLEITIAEKKKKIDSLAIQLKKLDSLYQKVKLLKQANTETLKREIEEMSTTSSLKERLRSLHAADSALPKGYQTLFALKSFSIGRSMADYSELSVKNISITGIQAEYNPRYYYAFAAGTVDYRFRDYIISRQNQPKQYLALVRAGKGEKDGNHIFLTYYTGRRQLYNAATSLQGNTVPNYNLMGVTVESRFNINRTTFLTAEVAKSSLPYYANDSTKTRNLAGNMLKFSNRSNEAWSTTLTSFIPYTKTTINATYRHTGASFQSFSLFTTGATQSAWSVKVDQPFFNRKLRIVASIRENDFINSFTNTVYQSNSIIKSIQATLRMRKWPVLSLGYFPSSQLTKLGDGRFSENLFYTLTGSASHFYKSGQAQLSSTLLYTQFYNQSSDSGFVYFNTRNVLFSQSYFRGRLELQFNFSASANSNYHLYVADQRMNYKISSWLALGGGLKYNKQTVYNIEQFGWSGNAKFKIPVLGDLELMFDKGFIPGANRQLVENKMGRLTYFKTF